MASFPDKGVILPGDLIMAIPIPHIGPGFGKPAAERRKEMLDIRRNAM
jgi:hypothetical protein